MGEWSGRCPFSLALLGARAGCPGLEARPAPGLRPVPSSRGAAAGVGWNGVGNRRLSCAAGRGCLPVPYVVSPQLDLEAAPNSAFLAQRAREGT